MVPHHSPNCGHGRTHSTQCHLAHLGGDESAVGREAGRVVARVELDAGSERLTGGEIEDADPVTDIDCGQAPAVRAHRVDPGGIREASHRRTLFLTRLDIPYVDA